MSSSSSTSPVQVLARSTSDEFFIKEASAAFHHQAAIHQRKNRSVRFYRFEVSSIKKLPSLGEEEKHNIYYSQDDLKQMKNDAAPKAKVLKDITCEWDDGTIGTLPQGEPTYGFEDGFSQMFD